MTAIHRSTEGRILRLDSRLRPEWATGRRVPFQYLTSRLLAPFPGHVHDARGVLSPQLTATGMGEVGKLIGLLSELQSRYALT